MQNSLTEKQTEAIKLLEEKFPNILPEEVGNYKEEAFCSNSYDIECIVRKIRSERKPFKITLRESSKRKHSCETTPRYEILLQNRVWGELYFNIKGYCGYLPTADGCRISIGDKSISFIKREISALNREAKHDHLD